MKTLVEIRPEETVVIRRVDAGAELKQHLAEHGIYEGSRLIVEEKVPLECEGPVLMEAESDFRYLSLGWAERVTVEKGGSATTLSEVESGNVVISKIEGGRVFHEWLEELNVREGHDVHIIRRLPDRCLVVRVWARPFRMDPGMASKILVNFEGKVIQLNGLESGRLGVIDRLIGEFAPVHRVRGFDLSPGLPLTMIGLEDRGSSRHGRFLVKGTVIPGAPTVPDVPSFFAHLSSSKVRLGPVEAEKVLVEPLRFAAGL